MQANADKVDVVHAAELLGDKRKGKGPEHGDRKGRRRRKRRRKEEGGRRKRTMEEGERSR